ARRSEICLFGGRPALAHGVPANGEKSFASDPLSLRGCIRDGGHASKADTNRFYRAQPGPLDQPAYDLGRRRIRCSSESSGTSPLHCRLRRFSGSFKPPWISPAKKLFRSRVPLRTGAPSACGLTFPASTSLSRLAPSR